MSASYVLTKAAEADLREIVRYTRKQWGNTQVLQYVSHLKNGIEQLVSETPRESDKAVKSVGKDLSEIYPGLHVRHCQHHYIFCLPRDVAPALIIAIFHERMDLIARVAGRLL